MSSVVSNAATIMLNEYEFDFGVVLVSVSLTVTGYV
jgi:hypothetical protein